MAGSQEPQEPQEPQDPQPKQHHQDDFSGLQVVETGLEVAEPRQGLSQNKTWEQPSPLPEPLLQSRDDPYKSNPALPAYDTYHNYGGYNGASPGTAYSSTMSPDYMNHGSYDPALGGLPEKQPRADRICGLRKQVFWAVVAIGVFAIVAAIAIGVGVGIATRNNGDDTPANATETIPVTGTPTNGLPAATAEATLGPEVEIACPDANQTLYTLEDDKTRKFLMLCGRDYSSQNGDGAVDMFSEDIDTMTGCIERCANQSGCAAVGWGDYYGTRTCWLKSSIGKPNVSPQWYAAVEADDM